MWSRRLFLLSRRAVCVCLSSSVRESPEISLLGDEFVFSEAHSL